MEKIKKIAVIILLIFLALTFTSFMPIEICNLICTLCVTIILCCFAKEYYDKENKIVSIILILIAISTIIAIIF